MEQNNTIPPQLQNKGFRFCKISKDKKAFETDWTNKGYTYEEINNWINEGNSYGVILGYGKLTGLDTDNLLLIPLIKKHFKETFTVKTGGGKFHFYFICKDLNSINLNKSLNKNKAHFGEIRTNKMCMLGPGSLHPSGNRYEVYKDVPILEITQEELNLFLKDFNEEFDKEFNVINNLLKNGKFRELFEGKELDFPSRSEADLSFVSMLKSNGLTKEQALEIVKRSRRSKFVEKERYHQYFDDIWEKAYKVEIEFNALELNEEDDKILTATEIINMELPKPSFLIDGILVEEGITLLAGKFKNFKSFTSLYFGLCCILGVNAFDRETKKIKVLYVDEENHLRIIKDRLQKVLKGLGKEENLDNLGFKSYANIKLDADSGYRRLRRYISEFKPNLVVIDSLVRTMRKGDTDVGDVKLVYETIKPLIKEFKTSWLILHHVRKSAGRYITTEDVRGSGDIVGFIDNLLLLHGMGNDRYVLEQGLSRIDKEMEPIGFKVINPDENSIKLELDLLIKDEFSKGNSPGRSLKKSEKLANKIKDWISTNQISGFKTKELRDEFKDWGNNAVADAIKSLITEGIIKETNTMGRYTTYLNKTV